MDEPHALVEQLFRNEYGRLLGWLARSFGARHLDRLEDIVQTTMERALRSWGPNGLPENPSAWLRQTARRLAIDWYRREQRHQQWLAQETERARGAPGPGRLSEDFDDESLRLLFLCCHPKIPSESRLAFALKTVGGFRASEIARGLLVSEVNLQKRLERARQRLREESLELESLRHPWMQQRVTSVQQVIYLLFTEGHNPAIAPQVLRDELCREAIRLAELLAMHPVGAEPTTFALLALCLFQGARLPARVGTDGFQILLNDQNREQWDWQLIRRGMEWLSKAAAGEQLSRYHLEAAIAWEHCCAASVADTDWQRIAQLYCHLDQIVSGPAQTLNWAIAESRWRDPQTGLQRLAAFESRSLPRCYPLWYAVRGQLHWEAGEEEAAIRDWQQALREKPPARDARWLQQKLQQAAKNNGAS